MRSLTLIVFFLGMKAIGQTASNSAEPAAVKAIPAPAIYAPAVVYQTSRVKQVHLPLPIASVATTAQGTPRLASQPTQPLTPPVVNHPVELALPKH